MPGRGRVSLAEVRLRIGPIPGKQWSGILARTRILEVTFGDMDMTLERLTDQVSELKHRLSGVQRQAISLSQDITSAESRVGIAIAQRITAAVSQTRQSWDTKMRQSPRAGKTK